MAGDLGPDYGHDRDRRQRRRRLVGLVLFVLGCLLAGLGVGGLLPGRDVPLADLPAEQVQRAVVFLAVGLLTAAGAVWLMVTGSQGGVSGFSAGENARRRRCRACDTMNPWHAAVCTACGQRLHGV
ncbi:hypothetical protein KLP28_10950 [Nocardioidaceae bacterium]|nr:hypothetical protein KLP28_10950 [Nocardioidaceae bacterium]